MQSQTWTGSLAASSLLGAAVFAATLIYAVDRIGWVLGLMLGWAPALLMGLAAAVAQLCLSIVISFLPRVRSWSVGPAEVTVMAPVPGAIVPPAI